jgi:hypothetical protein
MTGRGIPAIDQQGNLVRSALLPGDCATWLRTFAAKIQIVELDSGDVLDALDKAQNKNVQGGRIYDYIHAIAAAKIKSDELLTRNTDDFEGLATNLKWP